MKNRKLTAILLCMAFVLGISATGCAEKTQGGQPSGSQESREQGAGEGSEEPGRAESGNGGTDGNAEGAAVGDEGVVGNAEGTTGGSSADSAAQGADSQTDVTSQEPEKAFGDLNEFEAIALDGSTFTQDDFGDKDITVINFWALTCGPCLAEMPDLAAIGKALPDNVELMTVCLDGYGNEEYVEYVMEQTGFEGTTLLAGDGDLVTFCQGLQYTPTTVLVDSEGNTVGDAIIGGRENLVEAYADCINNALTEMGKAEISIDIETE